ncbi:hypothetical protein [Ruixingdingia sedimenti]|uniref:Uncharacterized protein n=1 Tax=Ruixingdingia sedimenti TaxID=3073604 RepID=A0ABU1FDZ3_9RHOB|nr:hypothetical protein [Xinfangfangia sp. LG-4]MDR5655107.1 hypothetical protein [Xinfangfangia sp. LG-4]
MRIMTLDINHSLALEDAAKEIIQREFKNSLGEPYKISPYHRDIFSQITLHLQNQGGNSYDVAIGFMLFIANSLVDPDDAAKRWAEMTFRKCERLMCSGALGETILTDS